MPLLSRTVIISLHSRGDTGVVNKCAVNLHSKSVRESCKKASYPQLLCYASIFVSVSLYCAVFSGFYCFTLGSLSLQKLYCSIFWGSFEFNCAGFLWGELISVRFFCFQFTFGQAANVVYKISILHFLNIIIESDMTQWCWTVLSCPITD